MRSLTPVQFLRLGGLMCFVVDGASMVAHILQKPQEPANIVDLLLGGGAVGLRLTLDVLAYVCMSGGFWYSIQERHMVALPPLRLVAVLLMQTLVSILFSSCNTFLVGAQAGFLLPFRWAPYWIGGQAILQVIPPIWFPQVLAWWMPPQALGLTGVTLWVAAVALAIVYHVLTFGLGALGGHAMRQKWELDRRHAELAAMQQIEAGAARLTERLSIARDLHDELGHHLTALSLQLQLAVKQADGAAKQTVESAYLMARTVLSDIRNTVTELHEDRAIDLPKALKTLVLGIHTPQVILRIGDGVDEVNALQSQAMFRAAQEAITNALRHAGAHRIWVELDATPAAYRLVVRDDGRGAPAFAPGNGVRGMNERVRSLGGRLEVGAAPGGQGFQVTVQLPRRAAFLPASPTSTTAAA